MILFTKKRDGKEIITLFRLLLQRRDENELRGVELLECCINAVA